MEGGRKAARLRRKEANKREPKKGMVRSVPIEPVRPASLGSYGFTERSQQFASAIPLRHRANRLRQESLPVNELANAYALCSGDSTILTVRCSQNGPEQDGQSTTSPTIGTAYCRGFVNLSEIVYQRSRYPHQLGWQSERAIDERVLFPAARQ